MTTDRRQAEKFKACIRLNETGHAHALTFSCFRRIALLGKERTRHWLASSIRRASEDLAFDVWAYVFMPEHVHLLIYPRQQHYSISQILFAIKFPVAKNAIGFARKNAPSFLERMEARQANGKSSYRFWERGGGYDRNISEVTTLIHEVRYIHANPVKRKLVAKESDWEWSSAADYHLCRKGLIPIAFETLPFDFALLMDS